MIEERLECLRAYGKEGAEIPVRCFSFFLSDSGVSVLTSTRVTLRRGS